ncbi:NAD(P)-dependent oxidoreductase [Chitinophaga deserti]|uniref:NAD(P)-dependent oxidoreductase n=1 Tax=Chitinophaga deserti TaxID=2164099 RepID=UPI001300BC0F|nr:NAD(P)-binding domain-containing protein [Chitinophaga deserti]
MKERILMIGLGAMGTVLARLLLEKGKQVTVWNRSEEKARPLIAAGATYSGDIQAAVDANDIILICLTDYAVTDQVMQGVTMKGKTVVQLSTGTPQDARVMAGDYTARGAAYLDGAILATPSQMGTEQTPIFLSGSAAAYDTAGDALRILGGTLIYQGEAPGAASAWDLAALSTMFGMMIGFLNGARIMESEGMQVADLGSMIHNIAPVLGQMIKDTGDDIQQQRFEDPQSSIDICAGTFALMLRLAAENKLDKGFAGFAQQMFGKAQAAGFGQHRISAIIKTLR